MRYFKIIQNGDIIGCGTNFIRWFPRVRRFAICDMEQAQGVQDSISGEKFHAEWLYDIPEVATYTFPTAEIVLIDADEYNDIYEELLDGEPIPIPEPEPEPEPQPEPDPEVEPEPRMTVQEMREKIAEQEEQIAILTECLLEMSEIVYGE